MDKKDAKPESTVFDVSKPGKTGASATSRPIIVTQEEDVKDPMVSASRAAVVEDPVEAQKDGKATEEKPAEKKEESLLSHKSVNIAPSAEAEQEAEDSKPEEKPDEEIEDKPIEEKPTEPEKSPAEESSAGAEVSAVARQAGAKKTEKETEEEIARRQALQELIDSKKYFVHISETQQKKSLKLVLIAVVAIAVVGAGLYFAMK